MPPSDRIRQGLRWQSNKPLGAPARTGGCCGKKGRQHLLTQFRHPADRGENGKQRVKLPQAMRLAGNHLEQA
jgi:hypothetical protein